MIGLLHFSGVILTLLGTAGTLVYGATLFAGRMAPLIAPSATGSMLVLIGGLLLIASARALELLSGIHSDINAIGR